MRTESIAQAGPDPFLALAEAMDAAVGTTQGGARRAGARLRDILPASGRLVSRLVYQSSYAVSFGLVFPAALLAAAIPWRNAVVSGLVDGARAAADASRNRTTPSIPPVDGR